MFPTISPMTLAKIAGGVVFVALLGVNAAQSWVDSAFVLPAQVRFALFVVAAVLGGAQLMLPRPGEAGADRVGPPAA